MPWNGTTGLYLLPSGQPVASGTTILASTFNNFVADLQLTLDNCVTRDGQGTFTGSVPIIDGTATAPGLAFKNEPSTGFYRPTAQTLDIQVYGATALQLTPTGIASVVKANNTTASTSTTTGALVVAGGVGIAGAVQVGGTVTTSTVNGTTLTLQTGATNRMAITGTGNFVIAAPTSGSTLIATGLASFNPSSGYVGSALVASGTFGGGVTLVDGSYTWSIYDAGGTLFLGNATGTGALSSRLTVDASGDLTTVGWMRSQNGALGLGVSQVAAIINDGSYLMLQSNTSGVRFVNSNNTVQTLSCDNSGNLAVAGYVAGSLANFTGTCSAAAGTSGNQLVNYSQFGVSIGTNGYTKLPTGIFFFWGQVTFGTSSSITFAGSGFPNACLSITGNGLTGSSNPILTFSAVTRTGCNVTSNTPSSITYNYLAIGY